MLRAFVVAALTLALGCGSEERGDGELRLAFPLEDPSSVDTFFVFGVDHDPGEDPRRVRCRNYEGGDFPYCYDGHQGTDYILAGGFEAMDAGSAWVIAAAAGTVSQVDDGHYDRCRGTIDLGGGGITGVDCDGQPMRANRVVIDHGEGVQSHYLHFKTDSIVVEVGQAVRCGERLGLVGSSGNSSAPHLHFELRVDAERVDPYAGPHSQTRSWWKAQGASITDLPVAGCD